MNKNGHILTLNSLWTSSINKHYLYFHLFYSDYDKTTKKCKVGQDGGVTEAAYRNKLSEKSL